MAKRPNLYDYLKIVAVITMIIDHLWYYFFPDQIWMRLVGRIAFPIFLFLVGFSNSYKRRRDIVIMASIIQISMWLGYHYAHIGTFQLNILWAIIGVRLFLRRYQYYHKYRLLFIISIMLLGMHFAIESWIDYGMLSWFLGIFGFLVRKKIHQKDDSSFDIYLLLYGIFTIITILIYNIVQFRFWNFDVGHRISWIHLGFYPLLLYIFFLLWQQNYILHSNKKRDSCIVFVSRNALLIYGMHLFLLSLIKWLFISQGI